MNGKKVLKERRLKAKFYGLTKCILLKLVCFFFYILTVYDYVMLVQTWMIVKLVLCSSQSAGEFGLKFPSFDPFTDKLGVELDKWS